MGVGSQVGGGGGGPVLRGRGQPSDHGPRCGPDSRRVTPGGGGHPRMAQSTHEAAARDPAERGAEAVRQGQGGGVREEGGGGGRWRCGHPGPSVQGDPGVGGTPATSEEGAEGGDGGGRRRCTTGGEKRGRGGCGAGCGGGRRGGRGAGGRWQPGDDDRTTGSGLGRPDPQDEGERGEEYDGGRCRVGGDVGREEGGGLKNLRIVTQLLGEKRERALKPKNKKDTQK